MKKKLKIGLIMALNMEARKTADIKIEDLHFPNCGKGDENEYQQKQGSDVVAHEDEALEDMLSKLNSYNIKKDDSEQFQNYKKSVLSNLSKIYNEDGKINEEAKEAHVKFVKNNLRIVASNFLEPEAVKGKNAGRCFINVGDELKEKGYLEASPFESPEEHVKHLHWHKIEITEEYYRRIIECSTMSFAAIKSESPRTTRKTAQQQGSPDWKDSSV